MHPAHRQSRGRAFLVVRVAQRGSSGVLFVVKVSSCSPLAYIARALRGCDSEQLDPPPRLAGTPEGYAISTAGELSDMCAYQSTSTGR